MTTSSQSIVPELYLSVINDVISASREAFSEEGISKNVLKDLKELWISKLDASNACDMKMLAHKKQPQHPQVSEVAGNAIKTTSSRQQKFRIISGDVIKSRGPTLGGSKQLPRFADSFKTFSKRPILINNVKFPNSSKGSPQTMHQKYTNQNKSSESSITTMNISKRSIEATPKGQQAQCIPAEKSIPVFVHLPPLPGFPASESGVLSVKVPISAVTENKLAKLLTSEVMSNLAPLPKEVAVKALQRYLARALENYSILETSEQLDGILNIPFEDDDSDESEEDDEISDEEMDERRDEPLNSDDDYISDGEVDDLVFDCAANITCKYEKVSRRGDQWFFILKDGVMNLNGKDYVFHEALCEAEF